MSTIERLLAVRPRLLGVVPAGQALRLSPMELLHAGPPLRDPRHPPPVLLSSAVVTCVHEGWARSADEAEHLVLGGEVKLSPAQSRGCVVPLACVVSAGTPLFAVGDGHGSIVHAPVSAVRGTDTRMGSRDAGLAHRLSARDRCLAPAWQAVLAAHGPLDLLPLAARGLAGGDDLHARTAAANAALVVWLRQQGVGELADDVQATPLFFLTLWMAACALMLRAAEGGEQPSLVTRAGGNGEHFGIALAGAPSAWVCVDATPPSGRRLAAALQDQALCGAIGDSAVVDMLGCGGQALGGAPEPLQAFEGVLPEDHADLADRLLCGFHPLLGRRVALDARRVVAQQAAPLVALAMLAADGRSGLAGRGLYRPPIALFERALNGLA